MKPLNKQLSDIRTYFRPLYWICQLFGISIISMTTNRTLKYCKFGYSIINVCCLAGYTVYSVGYMPLKFGHQNAVSVSVHSMQQIIGLFVILFIYYQVIRYKTKIDKVFQILENIDGEFHQLNIKFNYKKFSRKILIESIFVILFIYGLFALLVRHYCVTDTGLIVFEYFLNIHPILLINLVLLTFINFCWVIRSKLKTMRRLLTDFSRIDDNARAETDQLWKVKFIQETPKIFIREIRIIANVFEMLFKTVNILNSVFGLSNLSTMGKVLH